MKILSEERGQAMIFMAVFMGLVMLGFLALAIDVGFLFQHTRMAQAAADAAVIAAAEEGATTANGQNAAKIAAAIHGFDTTLATNPATVTLVTLSAGNYSTANVSASMTAPSNWVQATVSQPVHTYFLGAFISSMKMLTVSASAVAAGGLNSPTCICLEGAKGTNLNLSNGSHVNAQNCGIVSDSTDTCSALAAGGAHLDSQSLGLATNTSVSDWTKSCVSNGAQMGSTPVVTNVPACSWKMPNAPAYGACVADPVPNGGGNNYTVGPSAAGGTVCYKALTVNGNGNTVTLTRGIYVINGGVLHFNSGGPNLGGEGVVFFLTNGASLSIDNGANLNLVAGGNTTNSGGIAASTGIYNGIVFYQDPGYKQVANETSADIGDSNAISIQGGSKSYLNGAIYAPLANVTLGNGSNFTVTSNIVAKTLTVNGGGKLNATSANNQGALILGGHAYLVQ
jgi:Flp pilus assembly protein TadG